MSSEAIDSSVNTVAIELQKHLTVLQSDLFILLQFRRDLEIKFFICTKIKSKSLEEGDILYQRLFILNCFRPTVQI